MDNKEAIKNIKEHCYFANLIPQAKEALDIAIQALEQEPCEDVVSRQAVLFELDKYLCGVPFDEKGIDEVIKELPSVTARQKTGYWIKYGIPRCEEQHYKCTSCEYFINFGRWGEFYAREFKYCPHCGAEMKRRMKDE